MRLNDTLVDVSIIIVNWNTIDFLRNCLKTVFDDTKEVHFEVIVVDNGSTDGSVEMVKTEFPQVKLIGNGTNKGFPAANNQGIAIATGRYVLLLNSDTLVIDSAVQKLIRFADEHPEAGAFGGAILCTDRTVDPLCFRKRFDAWTAWDEYLLLHSLRYRLLPPRLEIREVDVLIGAYMMVRQEAIAQIGGLDERFFLSAEDIDWAMQVKAAGWKVYFYPGSRIIHFGSQSFKKSWDRGIITGYHSKEILFRKHYGLLALLSLRMSAVIGSLIRLVGWQLRSAISSKTVKADANLRCRAYWEVIKQALTFQTYESSRQNLLSYQTHMQV